jgi:hypothetical protein
MNFYGDKDKRNVSPELEPLFQAMMAGKSIASITIMRGEMNKGDTSKDITFKNVTASDYSVGFSSKFNEEKGTTERHDYVDATPQNFYMSWVRSFTL